MIQFPVLLELTVIPIAEAAAAALVLVPGLIPAMATVVVVVVVGQITATGISLEYHMGAVHGGYHLHQSPPFFQLPLLLWSSTLSSATVVV